MKRANRIKINWFKEIAVVTLLVSVTLFVLSFAGYMALWILQNKI